jgi:hypothetical protein
VCATVGAEIVARGNADHHGEATMNPWLRYLIAFIVFCHGFIYVRIGAVLPGPIKEWKGTSWLLGNAVTGDQLVALVRGLHVIAGIAILACAVAIAFAPAWWRPFAVIGAAMGLVALAVFYDGQTQFLFQEGIVGAGVSLVLLIIALGFPRVFAW